MNNLEAGMFGFRLFGFAPINLLAQFIGSVYEKATILCILLMFLLSLYFVVSQVQFMLIINHVMRDVLTNANANH